MKKTPGSALVALLLFTASARADIYEWACADDGDGALVINATWDESTSTLNMSGTQYGYPGHVQGEFITDTPLDPTVWIVETVENQTNFAWTDYHIDMGMTQSFSIVGVIAPPDWTWTITAPIGGQPIPNGGTGWLGSVDYYAGTPIPIGGSDSFGLVVSFSGSVAFSIEQVPTGAPAPVPEPGALLLGSIGIGYASGKLMRRKSL